MKSTIEIYDAGNGITAVDIDGVCIGVVTKSQKYPFRYALFLFAEHDFAYGDDLMKLVMAYVAISKTGI